MKFLKGKVYLYKDPNYKFKVLCIGNNVFQPMEALNKAANELVARKMRDGFNKEQALKHMAGRWGVEYILPYAKNGLHLDLRRATKNKAHRKVP